MTRLLANPVVGAGIARPFESPTGNSSPSYLSLGALFTSCDSHQVVATEANGDIVAFFRIHSGAVVMDCVIDSEDIGTTTAVDIGLYQAGTTTAVDANFFHTAAVLNDGALHTHCKFTQYGTPGHPVMRLWEALGLSADPAVEYDVCATYTGEPNGSGTFSIMVHWTPGS